MKHENVLTLNIPDRLVGFFADTAKANEMLSEAIDVTVAILDSIETSPTFLTYSGSTQDKEKLRIQMFEERLKSHGRQCKLFS